MNGYNQPLPMHFGVRTPHGRSSRRFEIQPLGAFSLEEARRFVTGFNPGRGSMMATSTALTLAFRLDRTFEPIVATVSDENGTLVGDYHGDADAIAVRNQVARMLSLDVDAREWGAVGERDPVVGALQAAALGFRPVCFPSAYEAAAWGVLGQRARMFQAAAWKQTLIESHGDRVVCGSDVVPVFPGPTTLLTIDSSTDIPAEKLRRLHVVARAALAGQLDAESLRAMPQREALSRLESLHGIGAWTAQHVLMRGCGLADALPLAEPRVLRGLAEAYGLGHTPTVAEYARIAEAWKPFRMWVAVLLVRALSGTARWHGFERRGARRTRT